MLTQKEKEILERWVKRKKEEKKQQGDPAIIKAMEKIYYSKGKEGLDFSLEVEKKIQKHLAKISPGHDYSGLLKRLRNPERAKFAAYTILRSFPNWERR